MVADFWNFYLKLLTNYCNCIYMKYTTVLKLFHLFSFILLKLHVELLVMYQS